MLNPMQLMQMLPQLKGNPMQFLAQRGIQIPQGMNNPQQIVQQMVTSGQLPQNVFNELAQQADQIMALMK